VKGGELLIKRVGLSGSTVDGRAPRDDFHLRPQKGIRPVRTQCHLQKSTKRLTWLGRSCSESRVAKISLPLQRHEDNPRAIS
jgi:hypothetical protein